MRELDKDAIVIVFTHTKMLGPDVNTSWDARPLCSHSLWDALIMAVNTEEAVCLSLSS